jgi:hypothetical protein
LQTANHPDAEYPFTDRLIDMSDLRKQFKGGKEVLRGVDLQVP